MILATGLLAAETPADPMRSRLLKHRVQLIAPAPGSRVEQSSKLVDVRLMDLADRLLPKEGVAVARDDWATAVDLAKSKIGSSELLRLVEAVAVANGGKPTGKDTPALVLYSKFGAGDAGRQVFLRLVRRTDGQLLVSADATAATMDIAIEKALIDIQKELLSRAWRCRVIDAQENRVMIARGRFDGIRAGQTFVGYSVKSADPNDAENEPDELLLMKSGKRVGGYRVTEAGEEYSRLEPMDGSPALARGDVLELPALDLIDRDSATRGSKLWDKIYGKDR